MLVKAIGKADLKPLLEQFEHDLAEAREEAFEDACEESERGRRGRRRVAIANIPVLDWYVVYTGIRLVLNRYRCALYLCGAPVGPLCMW